MFLFSLVSVGCLKILWINQKYYLSMLCVKQYKKPRPAYYTHMADKTRKYAESPGRIAVLSDILYRVINNNC